MHRRIMFALTGALLGAQAQAQQTLLRLWECEGPIAISGKQVVVGWYTTSQNIEVFNSMLEQQQLRLAGMLSGDPLIMATAQSIPQQRIPVRPAGVERVFDQSCPVTLLEGH